MDVVHVHPSIIVSMTDFYIVGCDGSYFAGANGEIENGNRKDFIYIDMMHTRAASNGYYWLNNDCAIKAYKLMHETKPDLQIRVFTQNRLADDDKESASYPGDYVSHEVFLPVQMILYVVSIAAICMMVAHLFYRLRFMPEKLMKPKVRSYSS